MLSLKIYRIILMSFFIVLSACSSDDTTSPANTDVVLNAYFPPIDGSNWESISPKSLNWNETQLDELFELLESNNTRGFIILKNGKIAVEKYWGETILGTADFNSNSQWYWASAGKSLTATLVGIAQQEGFLIINDKTSDYLSDGWTSMTTEQENRITIKNQLSMTTGLDYEVNNQSCTEPSCLQYKNNPGEAWYYHNAPYTLLAKVIENATGENYNDFTQNKLGAFIGMRGQWISQGDNNVYWSTARDMARFGLLILNEGKWDNSVILSDQEYLQQMTNSSQELNPAYGFLWWLNGKESVILPSTTTSFNIKLSDQAPDDLIAAWGKNGQFADVIPSHDMVVIRMGDAPNDNVPIIFHNQMWEKLSKIIHQN
jgi:CubicO group peptidase (beta-lactamase class C family)